MFKDFGLGVNARFNAMAKHELFVVDTSDLVATYLNAFPEGTNPIIVKQTEHDCSCCKNFLKNLGSVIAIIDGKVVTVWDDGDKYPHPYNIVAAALAAVVRQAPIVSVYRTKERRFGTEYNYSATTNERYDHFFGVVADRHFSKDAPTLRGERDAIAQVLRRGLEEIKTDDLHSVLDLIASKSFYRAEENKTAVQEFAQLKKLFDAADDKSLFVWGNLDNRAARFRNTAIGTLLTDLAEGKDLEHAVKSFESKVAPSNYKRTTSLISPKMIEKAVADLRSLGLEESIHRRMAKITDVSVHDVRFVDNAVRGQMIDGLTDLLMSATKPKPVDIKHAAPITIAAFMSDILPKATSMEVLVENRHSGNFVTMTAPKEASTGNLFKWKNDFAWSYDGELADSMREKVRELGGRVDGALRFTHTWNDDPDRPNKSLMDLHVFMPGWEHTDGKHDRYPRTRRVGWNRRKDTQSGGVQDVDYVNPPADGFTPVENISFPDVKRMPEGKYVFKIHNWNLRPITASGFKAEIEFGGSVFAYDHPAPLGHKEWVTVAEAVLSNGGFTITHKLATTTSSKKKWGIDTETLVGVDTLVNSPNHWEDAGEVGNKHWFFILNGCLNPNPVRGIYNEFLRGDLDKHRKVFEVLGSKTKCEPTDQQMSGVGFSTGRGDTVTVVVDKRRAYTITF